LKMEDLRSATGGSIFEKSYQRKGRSESRQGGPQIFNFQYSLFNSPPWAD
jgi:hypothetical protein